MYHASTQVSGGGRDYRRSGGRSRRRRSAQRERVRLLQLLVCLVLFLALFIGKGVFPGGLVRAREEVLSLISSNTDFRGAFARLGASLAGEGSVWEDLGDFCAEVFGAEEGIPEKPAAVAVPELTGLLSSEQVFLSRDRDRQALEEHFLPAGEAGEIPEAAPEEENGGGAPSDPQPEPEAVPAVGTVVLAADYHGPDLPQRCTMDQLSLGGLETVTPVLGHINSTFGYRDHPINGKYQFHSGLDIGAQTGDPIKAFADGTVEYVGKDDSYGLYFQLDHGDGIKSFYAHCDAVLVKKGQRVKVGETVAEVGSSGAATGPHLHLELKCGGLRLDPTYYIEYLTDR